MIGVLEETAYKESLGKLKTFTLEIAQNHDQYLKDYYAEDRYNCSKLFWKTGLKPVVRIVWKKNSGGHFQKSHR